MCNDQQQSGSNVGQKEMQKAYALANQLVRDRLANEDKEDLAALEAINPADILVVNGTYDHIHLVMQHLQIPHEALSQEQLLSRKLLPNQTVFVNCASSFPEAAARQLAGFVAAGGLLITTDWALKNVLEVGFPGYVQYNGKPTADEVVRIELLDRIDEVLSGFLDEASDPVWWLEGSSYPIELLNTKAVHVLMRSKELGERYGEEAVIVRFPHGEGMVYHLISHFYLQRTETREAAKGLSADAYATAKGAAPATVKAYAKMAADASVDFASVQSASTSAEFVSRLVIKQQKKKKL